MSSKSSPSRAGPLAMNPSWEGRFGISGFFLRPHANAAEFGPYA